MLTLPRLMIGRVAREAGRASEPDEPMGVFDPFVGRRVTARRGIAGAAS